MPYLLTDIRSHGTGKILYAAQGSEVQIISDHIGVLICEFGGVRFPVNSDLLSDTKPDFAPIKIAEPKERKSNKPLTQAEKLQLEYLNSIK